MSPRRRWLRRVLFLVAGTGVLLLSAVIVKPMLLYKPTLNLMCVLQFTV